jgi:hypothetical protein
MIRCRLLVHVMNEAGHQLNHDCGLQRLIPVEVVSAEALDKLLEMLGMSVDEEEFVDEDEGLSEGLSDEDRNSVVEALKKIAEMLDCPDEQVLVSQILPYDLTKLGTQGR